MHFNTRLYDYTYDMPADANDNFQILLQPGFVDTTILPLADVFHQPTVDCNSYHQQSVSAFGNEHRRPSYEDVDILGDRFYASQGDFESLLLMPADQVSQWKTKHINEWTGTDTRMWILDTAIAKKMKVAQIPSFNFSTVTGLELSRMSKETFCEILNTDGNIETSLIGDVLYEELQNLLQEAVVPATVIDKYNGDNNAQSKYTINNETKLLDMDCPSNNNMEYLSSKPAFTAFSDSGYDSLSDDYDGRVTLIDEQSRILDHTSNSNDVGSATVVKRPPGRPKGSGKKLPKRIKNVSVPEFLRDLLLDSRYCPRIIKWEDYSMGKFRFVRANEVAELWGGKKNNPKMSFEKFSRAMRYHYKQEVLVSVPTARLVYQFGPKAPQFTTHNPNFESPTLSPRFNSR